MNNRRVFSLFIIIVVTAAFAATVFAGDGWKIYRGNWFEIKYPSSFKAHKPHCESDRTSQSADQDRNCATFISPDKEVEFYIFAPQWAGDPVYVRPLGSEVIQGEKVIKQAQNGSRSEWVTYAAKDGSYLRSLLIIRRGEDDAVEQIFGVKYKDKSAYDRYKDRYDRFKNSLVRFAD